MKNYVRSIAFIVILIPFISRAQYTITSSSNPSVGDKESRVNTNTVSVSLGGGGTNKTWNYSTMQYTGSVITRSYVSISSIPNVTLYPGCNLGATTGGSAFDVYKNSSSARVYLGFAQSTASNCSVYGNQLTLLTLPFSYGDNCSDTYSVSANGGVENGSFSESGFGKGTLILPSYTLTNVLLVQGQWLATYTNGSIALTYSATLQDFYHTSSKFPVLSIVSYTINDGSSVDYAIDATVLTNYAYGVGIEENSFSPANVNLYPNPSKQNELLTVELTESVKVNSIEVFDISGRQVFNKHFEEELPENKTQLDISGLTTGIYTVKVKTNNGFAIKKLIIE